MLGIIPSGPSVQTSLYRIKERGEEKVIKNQTDLEKKYYFFSNFKKSNKLRVSCTS